MKVRHFALLFVVFLDLMNQGLATSMLAAITLNLAHWPTSPHLHGRS